MGLSRDVRVTSFGSLKLRNDIIQESTSYSEAAISLTGGRVDLGTASAPSGNTLNVNGAGPTAATACKAT